MIATVIASPYQASLVRIPIAFSEAKRKEGDRLGRTDSTDPPSKLARGTKLAVSLLDLCFRGGWAGVQALEVPFDDVEATELLDYGHRRWRIHLECDGGVRGAGADRELFPGSPDGLPHCALR
ncbi:hypothetical protein PAHAL_3G312400 [Panicum hallii]|uniref:Uncharacterized protein n=1 Tax=Panicum hallii TaxID=206008 RepID=A0A2T8KK52_9POAL|nr:hypothetical protein PAHAL_3G312400 [Panicum hallii]